jgi:hypothetical protein
MRIVGELDMSLTAWASSLPAEILPSEYLYCDQRLLPSVTFLALQYYQALFLLHRHALILNTQRIQAEVDRHFADQPYRLRLRNGHGICSSSARSVVSILSHQEETKTYSILNSAHAPLLAIYALAITIVRHPSARAVKADLGLQSTATSISSRQLRRLQKHDLVDLDEDAATCDLLTKLHRLVASYVGRGEASTRGNTQATKVVDAEEQNARPMAHSTGNKVMSPPQSPTTMDESRTTMDSAAVGHDTMGSVTEAAAGLGSMADLSLFTGWPPTTDAKSSLFGGQIDGAEMDWDALAFAFDLPQ